MRSPEAKLRYLAQLDTTMQSYLGAPGNTFRFFDTALPQGATAQGTCVTVLRVSEVGLYGFGAGRSSSAWPRFQFDVFDPNPETARALADYMKKTWLQSANIAQPGLFGCPSVGATFPAQNIVLNDRSTRLYQVQPPIYHSILDVRCYNREDF